MILFYPRDIGLWRRVFKFDRPGKLGPSQLFYDRPQFIEWLKEHGVRLDDVRYPLQIVEDFSNPVFGPGTFAVIQWTAIGWLKDNLV